MSALPQLQVPSLESEEVLDDPVLSLEEQTLPVQWTEELLVGLDWRKLAELARALAVAGGCEAGGSRLWPSGMVEFTLTQGLKGPAMTTTLVRLAPWNRWMASSECIESFAAELKRRTRTRGVYLAPAGMSPSARLEATKRGIEILDAQALAAALNRLPAQHSEYFHDVTVAGEPFVPSCPVCLRLLSKTADTDAREGEGRGRLPDLSYRSSDIVAEPVLARRIEVLRDCEVHFLREVHARDVFVQGIVMGDFVCEGALVLNPGAILTGSVAARSVLVRPGAELRGETRILQGNLGTAEKASSAWKWTCTSRPSKEGCSQVEFLPQ